MTKTKTARPKDARKVILDALRSATEPVLSGEIVEHVAKNRGWRYSKQYVFQLLSELEKSGLVFSRLETDPETENRGAVTYNYRARLYWAGGPDVPYRRSKAVYAGISLPEIANTNRRVASTKLWDAKRKKNKTVSTTRPGKVKILQTGSPLSEARPGGSLALQTDDSETMRLRVRVAELEAQLAALRKLLN